ncbi:DNA mismatch endonuclease Vsr [Citrobacter sp. JGM124]|uniref:very short patch repair endonuclease n=1 Tax=Citrobacter sp. JGM124 TaxID=2799789 RepID=UPI001BABCE96|nr:DNA mismatch endonuclease Vsr [Citrobacter sp. JGM124]MBS0846939.1 DNA mismatch endonuclease Vsr [Citrobacter sp. JGM124]
MADVHSKEIRSKNMRAIATRHTAIEIQLARLLTESGIQFHDQDTSLAGTPDFVIDAQKCIIFTHGCFWHHHECHLFRMPNTHREFWLKKIAQNVNRDRRNINILLASGWRVLVVWECALRGKKKLTDLALVERLEEWVFSGVCHAQIDTSGIHQIK